MLYFTLCLKVTTILIFCKSEGLILGLILVRRGFEIWLKSVVEKVKMGTRRKWEKLLKSWKSQKVGDITESKELSRDW